MPAIESGLEKIQVPEGHGTLVDLVYGALRDAIVHGRLAPGYRLREVPLSRRFNVSTTPVREAIRRLEREGLVVSAPRRGAIVSVLTTTQIISLYEIREVLECRAVRRAAEFATDFSRIESVLSAAQAVVHDSDQLQFNRLDIQFHRALSDLGGNSELAELAERVHRQIQAVRIRCSVYLPGRPVISQADHRNILDVVRTHDSDRAESLIRAHIVSVRDAVVEVLQKRPIAASDRS
jgi:DNA-binding GntR family transcriptional regulator